MARTASPADEGPYNLRSDGEPGVDGYLGCFRRGPAVFSLYQISPVPHRYTPGPPEYLIDVDDGAGARECGRFITDPDPDPVWNRAWNGDEWCGWIIERSLALIAEPDDD
ncbi:hypothetical protein LO763_01290 [Glycomyces sp. A-F 0318]|uniref:hypothetical protein n=1 Tax=Glycomyces amatae TaxID=2881355 RepID=UPI001E406801|nr:hypothetical protein [Glycomyces amatae]MCD0442259.1 hypothetical protein [Glycomyces amatae]